MLDFLLPTYYFHSIHDVDVSFFSDNAIKGLLFDIDNTLEPYETLLPSEKTIELFRVLEKNGIKIAIISNNHEKRVKEFCEPLDVPFSFDFGHCPILLILLPKFHLHPYCTLDCVYLLALLWII